jgi:hypothetical protein
MAPKDPESGSTESTPLVEKDVGLDSVSKKAQKTTVLEDALDTFKLGVPIFIAMLSWVGVRTGTLQLGAQRTT